MLRYRQSSDTGMGGMVRFNNFRAWVFIAVMSCRHLVANHSIWSANGKIRHWIQICARPSSFPAFPDDLLI